jgi:antitoxin YefM
VVPLHRTGEIDVSISASVNDDRDAVEIVSRKGNAVLISAEEYAAWQETAYLFRSPANARRLLDAYERARSGETESHELDRDQ